MDNSSKISIVPDPGVTKPIPVETVSPSPVVTNPSFGPPPGIIGQEPTSGVNSDLFDPEKLRVSQDFIEDAGVEEVHGIIPVRRPRKQEYVRVHPERQLLVAVIENEEDRELWVVVPEIATLVDDEISVVQIRLAVNKYGEAFLWPLKISRDGRRNEWNDTAMVAAEKAVTKWVRMQSVKTKYKSWASTKGYGDPEWPDLSFQELLELAFKGRIITSYDHPFLQQLRGEL